MTKEQFVKTMTEYCYQRKERDKWIDDVDKAFKGAWENIFKHDFEQLFIDTLAEVLNDNDEWLYYFVYEKECNFFSYEDENGNEIPINNFEKLYDLIKGEI